MTFKEFCDGPLLTFVSCCLCFQEGAECVVSGELLEPAADSGEA